MKSLLRQQILLTTVRFGLRLKTSGRDMGRDGCLILVRKSEHRQSAVIRYDAFLIH